MVEKFKAILAKIEKDKGEVLLFAVARMDELTDSWTVLLSGEWVRGKEKESFAYLVKVLLQSLVTEHISIAKLGVFTPDEHHVVDLLKFKKDTHITETVQANGNIIHEAYIFESRSPSSVEKHSKIAKK